MAIDKTKANKAMHISEGFAKIIRMRQDIETEFRRLEKLVAAENQPGLDSDNIRKLSIAASLACRREIIDQQATWHNIAYDRGYYDSEPKARKLSKTDPYKR